jgi:hypothetical protein
MEFLKKLIFPGSVMLHGSWCLWEPSLIGLHVVSDSLIALSCLPIPFTLVLPFREATHSQPVCGLRLNQSSLRQARTNRMEKSA